MVIAERYTEHLQHTLRDFSIILFTLTVGMSCCCRENPDSFSAQFEKRIWIQLLYFPGFITGFLLQRVTVPLSL